MVSQGRLQGLPKEESGAKKIICSKHSSGDGETLFENTEQQDSSNDNQLINSISSLENEKPYIEEDNTDNKDCQVTSQAQGTELESENDIPEQKCEPLYVRTKTGQYNRGNDYDDDNTKLMNPSHELGAGDSIIVDLEEAAINSFEFSKDQDFHNETTNHDLQDQLKNTTKNTKQSEIDFPHEDTLTKDNCTRIHDEHSPPSMQESTPEDNCFYMTSEGSPLQDSHESHPEISCSSQTVSSRNIVYRSVSTEDPTVVSNSLQTARKVQHLTLGSESQLLLSDVSTIPEQLPLILTEGDAEEHESLTLARTEQLQAVSMQTVLGTGQGSAGLMVFSSTDISPISSGHLIPINGTNLLVLQSIYGQGQLIQGQLIAGQPQILHKNIEQVSQGKLYGKQYNCPHAGCPKVAPTSSKLKLHMLSHTGERPHKCPLEGCDWAFTTAYKLKRHIRGHTGERPFICEVGGCGKRFTTTYNLKTHQKAHVREQDNICSFQDCQLSFSTLHKLKAHEKKHLLENELHTCNFVSCGKQFKSLSNYNAHLKNHNGERPHACTFEGCGKRFTKASKLKLHVRTHTGERPFVCEMENCDWSFTSAYKLKRHMRKHTGERPFTCEFTGCGRSFTRASHMRTHALSHTGQKPYICPLTDCLKGFTAASSLNIHMRKHSGDKPFKCAAQGCDKAYTTGANLRLHQKRHENKHPHLDDSIEKDEHLDSDHPRPMHYVEIGGVNSVVETDPSSAPATPYSVMHSFSGEDFASEDVASLTVVHFSSEETFPPQTPVSTMDSAGSICFQFSSSDSYAHPPHSSASSSISGLSFTAGTPLPSPGAQYTQTSMAGVEVETAEDLRTGTDGQLCSHDSPPGETTRVNTAGYIVREQTVCTEGTLANTEKEDEDLTLPTMVVFTSPGVQPAEDSSPIPPSNDLEARRSEEHGNSERNILTLQQPCESSAIEEFVPPEIIFQGEDVKGHIDNNLKDTERSALINHCRVQPSRPSNLSGLPVSNISLNLSSLSDDIDKSPVCPFITDVGRALDHESTINLQDLR